MTARGTTPELERELAEEKARRALKELSSYLVEAERCLERGGRFLDSTASNMARHVTELAGAGARLELLAQLEERS